MTREQAIESLSWLKTRLSVGLGGMDKLSPHYKDMVDEVQSIALAIAALRGPQADPETGLVPCGCGCEPELRNEYLGWYQVYCTGCDMHGGHSHTPDGVIEEWNTAMGWRVEG